MLMPQAKYRAPQHQSDCPSNRDPSTAFQLQILFHTKKRLVQALNTRLQLIIRSTEGEVSAGVKLAPGEGGLRALLIRIGWQT